MGLYKDTLELTLQMNQHLKNNHLKLSSQDNLKVDYLFPRLQNKTLQNNVFSLISVLYLVFLTDATVHAQPEHFAIQMYSSPVSSKSAQILLYKKAHL